MSYSHQSDCQIEAVYNIQPEDSKLSMYLIWVTVAPISLWKWQLRRGFMERRRCLAFTGALAAALGGMLMLPTADAFYLPGVAPVTFSFCDDVEVKVNKLTSVHTQLPLDYYSMPFCEWVCCHRLLSEVFREMSRPLTRNLVVETYIYKWRMPFVWWRLEIDRTWSMNARIEPERQSVLTVSLYPDGAYTLQLFTHKSLNFVWSNIRRSYLSWQHCTGN